MKDGDLIRVTIAAPDHVGNASYTDYTIESIVEPDVVADATLSDYSAGNKVYSTTPFTRLSDVTTDLPTTTVTETANGFNIYVPMVSVPSAQRTNYLNNAINNELISRGYYPMGTVTPASMGSPAAGSLLAMGNGKTGDVVIVDVNLTGVAGGAAKTTITATVTGGTPTNIERAASGQPAGCAKDGTTASILNITKDTALNNDRVRLAFKIGTGNVTEIKLALAKA